MTNDKLKLLEFLCNIEVNLINRGDISNDVLDKFREVNTKFIDDYAITPNQVLDLDLSRANVPLVVLGNQLMVLAEQVSLPAEMNNSILYLSSLVYKIIKHDEEQREADDEISEGKVEFKRIAKFIPRLQKGVKSERALELYNKMKNTRR